MRNGPARIYQHLLQLHMQWANMKASAAVAAYATGQLESISSFYNSRTMGQRKGIGQLLQLHM